MLVRGDLCNHSMRRVRNFSLQQTSTCFVQYYVFAPAFPASSLLTLRAPSDDDHDDGLGRDVDGCVELVAPDDGDSCLVACVRGECEA